jgi:oligopeptide transport system substrate-binding protein
MTLKPLRLAWTLTTLFALIPTLMGLAGGCKKESGTSSAPSTSDNSTTASARPFRFINRGDVVSLDLNQVSYLQDFRVLRAIREGLYREDPVTNETHPALAEKTEVSPDKKTWTFKLRQAKWSNGDPIVAGDFVFSWRLMLESPGEYTYLFYYIKGAKKYEQDFAEGKGDFSTVGVKALDDRTLVVELNNPVLFFEGLLSIPPFYPRHAASMEKFRESRGGKVSYRDEYTRPPDVVTNGPFNLVKWDLKQVLRMERNPNYWNVADVKSPAIEMVVNNDPLSAFQQYESKEIDWLADVQPNIAFDLKEASRPDLHTSPGFGTVFLTLNIAPSVQGVIDKNPIADMRVRQALAMAIDKQAIVNTITRMGERPATTYIPPGVFDNYTPRGGFELNVARARQLLADAGYPDGKGFPPIPIIYNTDNKVREQIAQMLGNQWRKNLGISIEVTGLELTGGFRVAIKEKKYLMGVVSWIGDYADPSTFLDKYLSTSQNNDSNWESREFDSMLASATTETDPAKRLETLARAEDLLNRELPIIPLYYIVNYSLFRDNVKGLQVKPMLNLYWPGVVVDGK